MNYTEKMPLSSQEQGLHFVHLGVRYNNNNDKTVLFGDIIITNICIAFAVF